MNHDRDTMLNACARIFAATALLLPISGMLRAQTTVAHVDFPEISAAWYGEPRWAWGEAWPISGLRGYPEDFFESIGKGKNFFGSALDSFGYRPVEIRFSQETTSVAMTLNRNNGYLAKGLGTFPGSVWDVSNPANPRRLNVCFSEDALFEPFNLTWDPTSTAFGKREIVFIMADDYDSTGAAYVGKRFLDQANQLNVMYVWWPRLVFGYDIRDTVPSGLKISPQPVTFELESGNEITLNWRTYGPQPQIASYRIFQGNPLANQLVDSVSTSTLSYTIGGLSLGEVRFFLIEAIDASGAVLYRSQQERGSRLLEFELLGHWNGRPPQFGTYGGVWGYVDESSGREYALFPQRDDGLSIIDVTTMPPVEVSFISAFGRAQEVRTWKTLAIFCRDGNSVELFDITNVGQPQHAWTIPEGAHTIHVYHDLLLLNGAGNGVRIYRLSETAAPQYLSTIGSVYVHDIDIRNDTLAAAKIYGDGVEFSDISNPSAPRLIGQFNYANSGAHNVEFTNDGRFLFVGDEIGAGNWTRIYDVTDLSNITQVGEMIIDSEAVVHNFYLTDTLLYVGHYTEGARVWNVANPAEPKEIAVYDSYAPRQYGYNGVWQIYPYLPSGKLLSGDMQSGLFVLRLPDIATGIEPPEAPLPTSFMLSQNYPNPFNPSTTIQFTLNQAATIQLEVINLLGQAVRTLASERLPAGSYERVWDGRTASGEICASGLYIYRLTTSSGEQQSRKLLLLK